MKDGRIGRFGWKAQVATLEDFVLNACANELGLEVPGHHQAASPLDPAARARGMDLTQGECNALVAYVRGLPPPVLVAPPGPRGSAPSRKAAGCSNRSGAPAATRRTSARSGASTATCCSTIWARS